MEDPVRLVLELAIFAAGIAALAAIGRFRLAAGFGIVVIIHLGLTLRWTSGEGR